jgi:hypothetical protein
MKRTFLLIATGLTLTILFLVRYDESRPSEKVFKSEETSLAEPHENLEAKKYSEELFVSDMDLDSLPLGPAKFKNEALEIFIDFEDPTVSKEQAYRISQDLNNVFSHLTARLVQHSDQKKLVFEGKGRNWPDVLDPIRMLQSNNGLDVLYVNKSVSDAYKEAFDYMEQQGIKEGKLARLLDKLASGTSSIADIVVFSMDSVPTEKLEEVLKEMSKGQIKLPSVLAYRVLSEQTPEVLFAETLFLRIQNTVATYAEVVGVARVNGEWKIAL